MITPSSLERRLAAPAERLERRRRAGCPRPLRRPRRRRSSPARSAASNRPSSVAAAACSCDAQRELVELPCGTGPSGRRSSRRRRPGSGISGRRSARRSPRARTGCRPAEDVRPSAPGDIDSTPPATATSYCPAITPAAAKCTACCDEPHWRSTVVPGTRLRPAGREHRGARRCRRSARRPARRSPRSTSSTRAGSRPVRSTSARRTCADRSTGWTPARPAVALADRRADGLDDDGVAHAGLLRVDVRVRQSERTAALRPRVRIATAGRRRQRRCTTACDRAAPRGRGRR